MIKNVVSNKSKTPRKQISLLKLDLGLTMLNFIVIFLFKNKKNITENFTEILI